MFVLLLALFPTSRVTVNDWCLEVKSNWAWAEKWKTGQLSSVGIVEELRARELLHLHPVPRISYGNQRPPVQRFVDQVVLYLDSKLKCSNKSNSNLHKSTLRRWWSPDMPGAVSKTKQPTPKLNKSGPENKTKAGDNVFIVQSPVDPSPEPPQNVEVVSSAEKTTVSDEAPSNKKAQNIVPTVEIMCLQHSIKISLLSK